MTSGNEFVSVGVRELLTVRVGRGWRWESDKKTRLRPDLVWLSLPSWSAIGL